MVILLMWHEKFQNDSQTLLENVSDESREWNSRKQNILEIDAQTAQIFAVVIDIVNLADSC